MISHTGITRKEQRRVDALAKKLFTALNEVSEEAGPVADETYREVARMLHATSLFASEEGILALLKARNP